MIDAPEIGHGWRRRTHVALEPSARTAHGVSPINLILLLLIIAAVALAIVETEPTIARGRELLFIRLQLGFGVIFGIEYAARVWIAAERSGPDSAWDKRWQFMLSPSGIIDLIVVIASLMPLLVANTAALRLLRLVRIISLARMGRLSSALRAIGEAVFSRRFELAVTAGLGLILVLFGATLLYWLEGDIQPDKFGSIPRSLWWAVVTITTIGYGDAFPITPPGKIAAAFIAIAGIGVIAMPAGILASAFSEAMQKHHGKHHHDI